MSDAHTTENAEAVSWDQGQPFSTRYGDRYFDADGLAESAYVFLHQNDLPARWSLPRPFVIGELGFGTGLNACLTIDRWLATAPAGATLDYISVEAHPLSPETMRRALSQWPQFNSTAECLAQACGHLTPGFNLRVLFGGRVRLLLLYGDAQTMLDDLDAQVDSWFLDGFAPARNPAMWSESIFHRMAQITRSGGRFSTYTAAGWVRRNLEAAGFDVQKAAGFGRKRDMLRGHLPRSLPRTKTCSADAQPWFHRPIESSSSSAIVVGAGLAGAATARSLAERGRDVTIYDTPSSARAAPSNLPGLIVRPYPERAPNLRGLFYDAGFSHATHRLGGAAGWHPTGVGVLTHRGRLGETALSAEAMSEQAGMPVNQAGQWIADAGWLDPSAWKTHWLDHPKIRHVHGPAPSSQTDTPQVIATGAAGSRWDALAPVSRARGQMSRLREARIDAVPRAALAGGGLCIPRTDGLWIGSSHLREVLATEPDPAEAEPYVTHWTSQLGWPPSTMAEAHATGIRAGTRDRMPQVGPIPDAAWWQHHYASVCHGRPGEQFPPAQVEDGQWLHRGHGSRGATAALLCAEVIAAGITGTPLPVSQTTWAALHPGRFLLQALRQGT